MAKDIININDTPQYYLNNLKDVIVFDTETTGFGPQSEILQLSITDGTGKTLFNEYLKPTHNDSWPEAEAVHHISPAMVADKKTFQDYFPQLQLMFYSTKMIVGYNTRYDISYLLRNQILLNDDVPIYDVMLAFAPINGEWNPRYNDYKWTNLTTCAKYYGYDLAEKAHNSLEDTKATAYCFRHLMEDQLKVEDENQQ